MVHHSYKFYMDEVDIHLSLSHDVAQFSFFDAKKQAMKKRVSPRAGNPGDAESFFNEENVFKGE